MSRIGVIVSLKGDKALVSTSKRGVCAQCSEKSSCAFDIALGKDKPEEIEVLNPINARVNDQVEFDLPGHTELKLSLLIWAAPVVGLVLGAVLGANLHGAVNLSQDTATLIGAGLGLIFTFLPIMVYDRTVTKDQRLKPRILKIVKRTNCPEKP